MNCCDNENALWLGCFDYCDDIALGLDSVQCGVHTFKVYAVTGTVQIEYIEVFEEEPLYIPAGLMNENNINTLQIIQPDGTLFEFEEDVYCAKFKTEVWVYGQHTRIC